MAESGANDRIRGELYRAVDAVRAELDRIEILAAAVSAFSRPIPDYEPTFQQMRQLKRHEMPQDGERTA